MSANAKRRLNHLLKVRPIAFQNEPALNRCPVLSKQNAALWWHLSLELSIATESCRHRKRQKKQIYRCSCLAPNRFFRAEPFLIFYTYVYDCKAGLLICRHKYMLSTYFF